MRLIDADKLKKELSTLPMMSNWGESFVPGLIDRQPTIEVPEIIHCKDCVKHNRGIGDFDELPDGTYHWFWKDEACPLVQFRGKAQGHEFDYQHCSYAERREESNDHS